jgi:hypothetical protein
LADDREERPVGRYRGALTMTQRLLLTVIEARPAICRLEAGSEVPSLTGG